jgi:hypothetical protein
MLACFFLGIGNFAMHKAVVESGHPFVEDTKYYFGRHFGRHGSYILEFAILAGAMLIAYDSGLWIMVTYFIYTALNAVAAWMLLSGRV